MNHGKRPQVPTFGLSLDMLVPVAACHGLLLFLC
jgi:hypothetical protein